MVTCPRYGDFLGEHYRCVGLWHLPTKRMGALVRKVIELAWSGSVWKVMAEWNAATACRRR
jgi:hypothetical protein